MSKGWQSSIFILLLVMLVGIGLHGLRIKVSKKKFYKKKDNVWFRCHQTIFSIKKHKFNQTNVLHRILKAFKYRELPTLLKV